MSGKSSACVDSSTVVAQQIADPSDPASPSEAVSLSSEEQAPAATGTVDASTPSASASAEASDIASEVVAKDVYVSFPPLFFPARLYLA